MAPVAIRYVEPHCRCSWRHFAVASKPLTLEPYGRLLIPSSKNDSLLERCRFERRPNKLFVPA